MTKEELQVEHDELSTEVDALNKKIDYASMECDAILLSRLTDDMRRLLRKIKNIETSMEEMDMDGGTRKT